MKADEANSLLGRKFGRLSCCNLSFMTLLDSRFSIRSFYTIMRTVADRGFTVLSTYRFAILVCSVTCPWEIS